MMVELIEKRRKLHGNEGTRSERWHTFKDKIQEIVVASKTKYYGELKKNFSESGDPSKFYVYVQAFMNRNSVQRWDVRSLDSQKSNKELAEWLADYFNGISEEY